MEKDWIYGKRGRKPDLPAIVTCTSCGQPRNVIETRVGWGGADGLCPMPATAGGGA
jgi:hypothetical protein